MKKYTAPMIDCMRIDRTDVISTSLTVSKTGRITGSSQIMGRNRFDVDVDDDDDF